MSVASACGQLAFTGRPILPLVAVGAGALAVGGIVVLAVRRHPEVRRGPLALVLLVALVGATMVVGSQRPASASDDSACPTTTTVDQDGVVTTPATGAPTTTTVARTTTTVARTTTTVARTTTTTTMPTA